MRPMRLPLALLACLATGTALAAPAVYDVDPTHTHPVFETDHFNGMSVWRGLFKKSRGTITLDKAANAGSVDIYVDTSSVTLGVDKLDEEVAGTGYLESNKFPEAHYTGKLGGFVDGAPTLVDGQLTLHGVTKPLQLKILSFKCATHPLYKRDWCGADALGSFNRDDFGIDAGKPWGFKMGVTLRIQVEAVLHQ